MGLSKRQPHDQNDLIIPQKNIEAIAEEARDPKKAQVEESEDSDDVKSSSK